MPASPMPGPAPWSASACWLREPSCSSCRRAASPKAVRPKEEPEMSGHRMPVALIALVLIAVAGAAGAQAPAPTLEKPLDVPYVPTKEPIVDRMLQMAAIKPGDVIYDLGCGDGRIVIAAAKRFGVRGVGVDIDPQRIAEA